MFYGITQLNNYMEEDIHNHTLIVMFRGTPCIWNRRSRTEKRNQEQEQKKQNVEKEPGIGIEELEQRGGTRTSNRRTRTEKRNQEQEQKNQNGEEEHELGDRE